MPAEDLHEALERYHQTALRAREHARSEGVSYERARVRKRLLDTVRRIAFTARDGGAGGAEAVVVLQSELLAALDRICPPQAGAKPRPEDCPCGDYGRPGHPIGEWCGQGKG